MQLTIKNQPQCANTRADPILPGNPIKITLNKCILSFSRTDFNANICPGIFMPIFPYIYLGGMCNGQESDT
nr:MAG TPA: hypothetical protein [Caudoviricetes sp.]